MNQIGHARNRFELEGLSVPSDYLTDTVATMTKHESRRGFQPRDISEELANTILTAARSAPTSSNLQAYSIIVVRDEDRRHRISHLTGNQQSVREAPVLLVFCADIFRLRVVAERQRRPFAADTLEMFLLASVDAALCMQNALVAAESLGLAGVPIGSVRNDLEAMAEELELPEGVFAVVGLALGWPRGEGRGPKPRLPMEATVHTEQYSSAGLHEALDAYDATMIERGVYRGRHVVIDDNADPLDDEPEERYGWSEHTARRCSAPEALGAASLREHLREEVQRRGFSLE